MYITPGAAPGGGGGAGGNCPPPLFFFFFFFQPQQSVIISLPHYEFFIIFYFEVKKIMCRSCATHNHHSTKLRSWSKDKPWFKLNLPHQFQPSCSLCSTFHLLEQMWLLLDCLSCSWGTRGPPDIALRPHLGAWSSGGPLPHWSLGKIKDHFHGHKCQNIQYACIFGSLCCMKQS